MAKVSNVTTFKKKPKVKRPGVHAKTKSSKIKGAKNYLKLKNWTREMKKQMLKRKDGSVSPRGLWDNIRDNKGSGKKPTKAMLKQEKTIKSKKK